MRIYLRLVNAASNDNAESEEQHLRSLLKSAPGTQSVTSIEKHPKGGYAVVLEALETDAIVAHVSSHGYDTVI
jgi:hypothetical protein